MLKSIVLTCLSINCYASSELPSSFEESPLSRLHSYQRVREGLIETTSLSVRSLNDDNIEAFSNMFSNFSGPDRKRINTLCINSIKGKENTKRFFEIISPVLKDILSIEFCSQEMDWNMVGKYLSNFPQIRRIDFNSSGITDIDFDDFIGAYNYYLGKKRMSSTLKFIDLNRCEKITPEGLTPIIASIATNTNKYPHLLGIGLQQRNGDWPRWAAISFPLINQAIDVLHSQRMTCFHDGGTNNNIAGESTLYRGAFLFTPASNSQKTYQHSQEIDRDYSAWFNGVPLTYNTDQ